MTSIDIINDLSIVVLVGFLIALGYLIALLHRANRLLGRLDSLQSVAKSFVNDIVPAIINVGTIAASVEGVIRSIHKDRQSEHKSDHHKSS